MINAMVIIYLFYKVMLGMAGAVLIFALCSFKVFAVVLLVALLIGLVLDVSLTISMIDRIKKLEEGR